MTTFKPSASPIRSFNTPIQQIVSAPADPGQRAEITVAVRTAGSTVFLEVQPKLNTLSGVVSKELATFTRADCGDRLLMDVMFTGGHDSPVLTVNDAGNVFRCSICDGDTQM